MTSVGVIVRQQAWFRASVDVASIGPFDSEKANLVSLNPAGSFRARVLIGRGPVAHDLTPEFLSWFEHGEEPYPVFQCPSIGPRGGGLYGKTTPRRVTATSDEVVCLIEISLIQPVQPSFQEDYERPPESDTPDAPTSMVRLWLSQAKTCLEQAVGLYALYQYPVVWEPLAIHPIVGFVNLEAKTFQLKTPMEMDNFIPFRLNVAGHLKDGQLVDQGLGDLPRLEGNEPHLPLVLLQRALWQRNLQLRFLETFLLLDYLTSQYAGKDPARAEREELFTLIEQFVRREHPEHEMRIRALKHIVLQAPLKERMGRYLRYRAVSHNESTLARMLRVRNDLAHARTVDPKELAEVELEVRSLAREAMRRELASRGIRFGDPPSAADI